MTPPIETIAIVGAGVMGRGIALLALTVGKSVILSDLSEDVRKAALDEITSRVQRLQEKGKMTGDEASACLSRLKLSGDVADLEPVDLVLEAIIENLEIKQRLLHDVESVVSADTLIATNTSSFLVSEFAANAQKPDRVLGLHFFNPAPLMKLVEVIAGTQTNPKAVDRVTCFVNALGHVPVEVADVNGFLVNQLGRGYILEAARLAEEGIGDFKTIDRALKRAMGFKMGPFELMDLTGLDVTYPASRSIWEGNGFDSRFLPPALMERRLKSKTLGQKSGIGFHVGQDLAPADYPEMISPDVVVWCPPKYQDVLGGVCARLQTFGASVSDEPTFSKETVIIVPLGGKHLLKVAKENNLPAERCVGVDNFFGSSDHLCLSISSLTSRMVIESLQSVNTTILQDKDGTVCQRILLQLGLIASDMLSKGVASEQDIDIGAKLALGHVQGPFERMRQIGLLKVENLRSEIFTQSAEERFRPSIWLTERALCEEMTQ
ncbi:MAG: hypothetical protein HWE30_17915 [Methylocystaceae bacterium]|nr:hypothetical protein [Methylocystaceae bacterium]